MKNKFLKTFTIISLLACFSTPQVMSDVCGNRAKGKSFEVPSCSGHKCKDRCSKCGLDVNKCNEGGMWGQKAHCSCKSKTTKPKSSKS